MSAHSIIKRVPTAVIDEQNTQIDAVLDREFSEINKHLQNWGMWKPKKKGAAAQQQKNEKPEEDDISTDKAAVVEDNTTITLAKAFLNNADKLEKQFTKVTGPAFKSWARRVGKAALRKLRSFTPEDLNSKGITAVLKAVHWQEEMETLQDTLEEPYQELAEKSIRFANQSLSAIGVAPVKFDVVNERVVSLIQKQSLAACRSITKTVRKDVRTALAAGVKEGEGIPKLAKRLQGIVEGYAGTGERYRAERVARTEVIDASNRVAVETYKAAGTEIKKVWLDTEDDRQDDGDPDGICFQLAKRGPIPMDDEFAPGIRHGPAHVNCRCTVIPYIEDLAPRRRNR